MITDNAPTPYEVLKSWLMTTLDIHVYYQVGSVTPNFSEPDFFVRTRLKSANRMTSYQASN